MYVSQYGYQAMVTQNLAGHLLPGLMECEGHRDYSIVPEWLNAALGTESCARVTKLIDEICEVERRLDKAVRAGWYVSTSSRLQRKAVRDELQELGRRHDRINELLERYHFSPAIIRLLFDQRWMLWMFSAPAEGEYVFHRVLHEENKKLNDGSWLVKSHSEYDIGEASVVLRILNLAAASEIERLKQCRSCSKWFYAERSHQRFCSEDCRLASYTRSPKYKNYRKQYMRRRRSAEQAASQKGR